MLVTPLVCLLLGWQSREPNPAELVARLGAARFAEREAAAVSLEKLGRRALPALRSVQDAKDLEVRNRASLLIDRIESRLLTDPSMIRLDFQDVPVAQAVAALGGQAGVQLALDGDDAEVMKTRKVTLRESQPLPFWSAVDRFCQAARLRLEPENDGQGQASVHLFDAEGGATVGPTSDDGPFRVKLKRIDYARRLSLERGPDDPKELKSEVDFNVSLQFLAEPRLMMSPIAPVQVIEAADNLGHSFLPKALSSVIEQPDFGEGPGGVEMGAGIELQVRLDYPERPGTTMKIFRGSLPVVVSSRKSNPMIVPLPGSASRLSRPGDFQILIHDLAANADGDSTLTMTIRPKVTSSGDGPSRPIPPAAHLVQTLDSQLEIVDAKGKVCSHTTMDFELHGNAVKVTLSVHSGDEVGPPTELRYYSLVRTKTEVRFTFRDVRMP